MLLTTNDLFHCSQVTNKIKKSYFKILFRDNIRYYMLFCTYYRYERS